MGISLNLNQDTIETVSELFGRALDKAARALSHMTGLEIRALAPKLRLVPLSQVIEANHGSEAPTIGAYLSVRRDVSGHMVMLLPGDAACGLVDLLSGNPSGTTVTLDAMGMSALAETANIVCSTFVNEIADYTGLRMVTSVPAMGHDMRAALLTSVLVGLYTETDQILVMETALCQGDNEVEGLFLFATDPGSFARLVRALEVRP